MNLTIQNVLMRMNRTYIRMAFFAAVAVMSLSILVVKAVGPTTYNVGPTQTYTTIQAAVNAASAGDIIQIDAGTYNENVTVNKTLQIVGAGAGTVIDGTSKSGNGIYIANNVQNVEISGLVVQNFASGSGIHANAGNNGLNIHDLTVTGNNSSASANGGGFYANGPVDNVTINNIVSSNNKQRGIVIWNGFKTRITITNNTVTGNSLSGIELQDGTSSGVNVSGNTSENNGDSGMSLIGMMGGAGANIVSNNTIRNNGRFGMEVKLPNGTGMESGDGSIVISGNTVERTQPITVTNPTEVRDLTGIAVIRRGWVAGNNNADIPRGVVVKNNTVSGFVQPSTSEGFGIVVEGIAMHVYNNTTSGNDVDIQQQAGNTPYVAGTNADGDQTNKADQYAGRGNSPVVCANIHDNNGTTARSVGTVGVIVAENTTKGVSFCTIQAAIDDPVTTAGDVIAIQAGTHTELLNVNKSVELTGNGAVTLTSPASGTNNKIINVSAADVRIHDLSIVLNRPFAQRAISATNSNNIKIYNNTVSTTGTGASWPRIGIYVDQTAGSGNTASIYGNTIYGTDANTPFEGRGISTHQIRGVIGGDDAMADKNTIYAWFDVLAQFTSGGSLTVKNNEFQGGGVDITEPNTGGNVLIEENTFSPKLSAINTQTLLVKNVSSAPVVVKNNTFTGFKVAVNNANSTNVTYEGNVFNPSTGLTDFTNVVVTNKVITGGAIAPRAMNLTFINNAFNGNGSAGGTGAAFLNHNSTGAVYGTVVFGGEFAKKNTFANTLTNYIVLDGQSFADSQTQTGAYPEYAASNNAFSTTGAPFAGDITALVNDFGGMTDPVQVESKLVHKPDNAALGLIAFQPLNGDTTLSSLTVSDGALVPAFNPSVLSYTVTLRAGTTAAPAVAATANAAPAGSSVTITQAAAVPGTATVLVTAQNGATGTYSIAFQAETASGSSGSGGGGGYSNPADTSVNNGTEGAGQGTAAAGGNSNSNASNTGSTGNSNTNTSTGSETANTGSGIVFNDTKGHWAEMYIEKLADKCKLSGYTDNEGNLLGEFRPDGQIARSELVQMLFGCEGKKVPMNTDMSGRPFSDVNPEWFDLAVRVAKTKGWLQGYADGTFRPYDLVNRAEALKMILSSEYSDMEIHSGLMNIFSDVSEDEWYARYIHFAYEMGIVKGYEDYVGNVLGYFLPNSKLTRAEAAKIIVLVKGY